MAFFDILAAQGVRPVSAVPVVSTAGIKDILAAQGVIPVQAVAAAGSPAGVRSWSQLAGIWVDGSAQEVIVVEPPAPSPGGGGGRGSGPTTGVHPEKGFRGYHEWELEETRRKRILTEDDDIVALIVMMVQQDML